MAPQEVDDEENHSEHQKKVNSTLGYVKYQPGEEPTNKQDKEQDEKNEIADQSHVAPCHGRQAFCGPKQST
jgi:hypothetical protein